MRITIEKLKEERGDAEEFRLALVQLQHHRAAAHAAARAALVRCAGRGIGARDMCLLRRFLLTVFCSAAFARELLFIFLQHDFLLSTVCYHYFVMHILMSLAIVAFTFLSYSFCTITFTTFV